MGAVIPSCCDACVSTMFDTDKFIECVHDQPVLWDKHLQEYSDRNERDKCWILVGEMMYSDWLEIDIKEKDARNTEAKEPNGRLNEKLGDTEAIFSPEKISKFRKSLPQYLAALANNLLLLDLGMVIAFPTIVIPPLLNAKEGLHFTKTQASWFGSIVYFIQPLGSLFGASALDYLGRRRSMLFLNVPFFFCWAYLHYADSVDLLFLISAIMGLGIGSIEASILTYVGEISEPRNRGTLTSMAEIAEYMGFVFIFFIGTVTDWRTCAAISALIPIISAFAIWQIPDTPIWLLSRGREDEALKALCWLRGWVKPEDVQAEFDEIVRYSHASKLLIKINSTADLQNKGFKNKALPISEGHKEENSKPEIYKTENDCIKKVDFVTSLDCDDPFDYETLTFREKLRDFCRPEMMRPMFMVCSFFFFTYGSGMLAIRPYTVPVFEQLGFSMDPYLATAVFTAIGLGGCVLCTVTVQCLGKRPLALISIAGCGISCLSLGAYAFYIEDYRINNHASWMPMLMMVSLTFFTGIGMDPLPWMYLSEVFPFRGRSLASGVAAGVSYIFGFIVTKTFLGLEATLTLSGVFFLYGSCSVVGFVFFYFYLPETEGRSMEDIEESYKRKNKQTS